MSERITPEMVKKAEWKPVFFMDLADGGYRQQYRCVTYPRVTLTKWAETGRGPHRQQAFVDGNEVNGSTEIAAALNGETVDG